MDLVLYLSQFALKHALEQCLGMDTVTTDADSLGEVIISWTAEPGGHFRIREEDACVAFGHVGKVLDKRLSRDYKAVAQTTVNQSIKNIVA